MREIKFRSWDKVNKKMVYAYPLWKDQTGCIFAGWESYHCDELAEYQQYTGLKDKNGKEIYEGDIVTVEDWDLKNGPHVIEFCEGCFYLKDKNDEHWFNNVDIHPTEIIGNIYENPELC